MPDRIALVTGAGKPSGLGFAVARALVDKGIKVILTARDYAQAKAPADDLGQLAQPEKLDVTDPAAAAALAAKLAASLGRLDILINNAAALSPWDE